MMAKAADVIDKQSANIKAVQERNEFWRNLLVASAWDSVTGMERPISSVIRECAPALMGNGALFGVSNAPLRDGEPGVISVRP